MSKATEPNEILIASEEWAAMLHEAGAPEPWADPAAPQRFADGITFHWPQAGKRKRNNYDRASNAIAELRRVLPKLIAENERFLEALKNPPAEFQHRMIVVARLGAERERDKLHRLFAALPKPRWQLSKPRTPPWHLDAARLYTLYRRHVDPEAGTSADGPAIRFVQLALIRMGSRGSTARPDTAHAEREDIGRTLRRMAEHARRRKLDRSSMD